MRDNVKQGRIGALARATACAVGIGVLVWATAHAQGSVTVNLKDVQGKSVGTAMVSSEVTGGVKIQLDLMNLPPGRHAIQIYALPQCAGQSFNAVGTHFNPDNMQHGTANTNSSHSGDLGNFVVDANGTSKAAVMAKYVDLGAGSHSLFSGGGTALVIHAGMDDGKTQPSGNAGAKIACGEIKKM